ncbi:SUMO-conjugating enzyme-like [Raphidocelis subcapitata]|uniref:SUMO-conjugating enzyme-like n=1 Tax=Raphidocelis subcapitata TaxID=307507 RepID=A0A2V0PAU4_9CHLO|nr:SUMO-conjugating enzyme-like [Raphidocelis subcapitata]|eukprot:GBF95023.1 SUMO-conjugating enzyme-like [Raphidocelis subcapitata]
MAGLARGRLAEERKQWRKDHPPGFVAKPRTKADGSTDLMIWDCKVPGREGTDWEGGLFPVTIVFSEGYPNQAPACYLPQGFFHPNVFENGQICLSLINDDPDLGGAWRPAVTNKQILQGIQELLDDPYTRSPAQRLATELHAADPEAYRRHVRAMVARYPADREGAA